MADIVREKVFEHYLEFPEELRMMIIDEMSTKVRCRFRQCSKSSQKEAMRCKKFMYGMKFFVYSAGYMVLDVVHTKNPNDRNCRDYSVHFVLEHDGKKGMSYTVPLGGELWTTQLDKSTDLIQYACETAKYKLQMCQNTIRNLEMYTMGNYEFEMGSLSNLERLKLDDNIDIQQFISKIRKPLKELDCLSPISNEILEDFEQIYRVQDLIKVQKIDITYEQFQKLSAKKMYIDIGILTEEDICDFIQSWQNNKLRNNFQSCQWCIFKSNFDIQKLLELLRIHQNFVKRQPWTKIDIMHNTDAGKKAELGFYRDTFEFRVINQ